jgi:hypothetical protein
VVGALVGEVTEVGYLGLTLVPPDAGRLWVPHLVTLWTPVRHLPNPPPTELEIPIDPHADPQKVLGILAALETLGPANKKVEVRLLRLTPQAAVYGIRLPPHVDTSAVLLTAWVALTAAGISVDGKTS